jgi:hypothetical protein
MGLNIQTPTSTVEQNRILKAKTSKALQFKEDLAFASRKVFFIPSKDNYRILG